MQAKSKKRAKRITELNEIVTPQGAKKFERRLSDFIMDMDEKSLERAGYVERMLDKNDDSVADLVGHMVEAMEKMDGPPRFVFEGQTYNQIKGEQQLLAKIFARNYRYLAVRILVSLAEMDVRLGSFKLPAKACARCGGGIK